MGTQCYSDLVHNLRSLAINHMNPKKTIVAFFAHTVERLNIKIMTQLLRLFGKFYV